MQFVYHLVTALVFAPSASLSVVVRAYMRIIALITLYNDCDTTIINDLNALTFAVYMDIEKHV
ncbi:hypothetical protein ccbrp13_69680 [Ktedonobacteria bacterium brp13]|nr:hypothetical protein ccbrp13_69680 [Ktedonobacteria bacterium brp13]